MKILRALILILSGLTILSIAAASQSLTAEHADNAALWQPAHRLEELLAEAAAANRPLWLMLSSPGCGACRQLKQSTGNNPVIAQIIRALAIAAEADRSTPEGRALHERFPGSGVPRSLLLTPQAEVKASFLGSYHKSFFWILWLLEHGGSPEPPQALLALAENALPAAPDFSARAALALLAVRCGQIAKAREYLGAHHAPLFTTQDMSIAFVRIWCQPEAGTAELGTALDMARDLVRKHPRDRNLRLLYLNALRTADRNDAARREAERVLNLCRNDMERAESQKLLDELSAGE